MGIGAQELAKLARLRICAGCGCVTLCHVATAISGIVQPQIVQYYTASSMLKYVTHRQRI